MAAVLDRFYGTGRRKTSVARVWIRPGSGRVSINKRGFEDYFPRETLRMIIAQPFEVTTAGRAGEPLGRVYPHLRGLTELTLHDLDATWLAQVADVVFLALPHMESQRAVPVLRAAGRKVIDLSADYRLRDAQDYVTW